MNTKNSGYCLSHISNGHGVFYDKTYESGYYMYQWIELEKPLLKKIFQDMRDKGMKGHLDFACGTGRIAELGEGYFDKCLGVDVSEEMLDVARSRCKKTTLLKQDVLEENLEDKFNVITAFRFFLNAENELRKNILNVMNELLEDDGYLVANIHVNSNSILGYVYRIRNKLLKKNIANTMSFKEFEKYLGDAGFVVSEVYWYSYLPRIGWRFPWLYKLFMTPFEKICSSVHLLPRSMAQCFLVVAIKK